MADFNTDPVFPLRAVSQCLPVAIRVDEQNGGIGLLEEGRKEIVCVESLPIEESHLLGE